MTPTKTPTKLPRLIALTGTRRSGKTEIAKMLVSYHGYTMCGFADPIREMVALLLDETLEQLEGQKEEKVAWLGVTRRYLMQTLGTEWGRKLVGPTTWLLHAAHRWDKHEHVVVPDLRFPDEASFVRHYIQDAQIWRVMRDQPYDPRDTAAQHASETELYKIDCDAVIPNTGTISQLYANVKQLLEHSYGRD